MTRIELITQCIGHLSEALKTSALPVDRQRQVIEIREKMYQLRDHELDAKTTICPACKEPLLPDEDSTYAPFHVACHWGD